MHRLTHLNQADDMNPNTTIIYLGSSSLSLSKQLYNKSIVITNYTRSIAEMLQVLQTGKPIDEQPLPAGTNSSLYVKAQRIVAFEKKMSENLPDPEVSSDIEVNIGDITATAQANSLSTTTNREPCVKYRLWFQKSALKDICAALLLLGIRSLPIVQFWLATLIGIRASRKLSSREHHGKHFTTTLNGDSLAPGPDVYTVITQHQLDASATCYREETRMSSQSGGEPVFPKLIEVSAISLAASSLNACLPKKIKNSVTKSSRTSRSSSARI